MRELAPTRMTAVQSPIIPTVGEWIRATPGTISLGQGVVHYGPPPAAWERLADFAAHPQNHYQAGQGLAELRQAIAHKLAIDNGLQLTAAQAIMVTAGSNMAFLQAVLAITQPGDQVIVQTPYYFNHEMAIAIAGCEAVCVPTDDQSQLQVAAIAAAITPRTRAIVTISPNNPTGVVYPRADLEAVNQLCRDRGLYHIHDAAYEYFTYGDATAYAPAAAPDSAAHTISLFSLSKAYGFASWRIGYMLMPAALLPALEKIQDTNLICAPVVSQVAAIGALQAGSSYCRQFLPSLDQVRQQAIAALAPLVAPGHVAIAPATGAFYLWLRLQLDQDALTVTERLIREHRVAVLPGTTFGVTQGCYLRVAYGALQPATVQAGMNRLVTGLQAIGRM